jgi:hypothetical protein
MREILSRIDPSYEEPIREAVRHGWFLKAYGEAVDLASGDRGWIAFASDASQLMGFWSSRVPGWTFEGTNQTFADARCGLPRAGYGGTRMLLFSQVPPSTRLRALLEERRVPDADINYWSRKLLEEERAVELSLTTTQTMVRLHGTAVWSFYAT